MKGVSGVIAGLCCALVIACAAGPSSRATMPAAQPTAGATAAGDPHQQIAQLEAEIDAERERLSLPAPAAPMAAGVAPTAMSEPPKLPTQDPSCKPAPSDTCTDSCKLADSICSNAGKICNLAHELAGDDWAASKCTTARTTCEAAHGKCCGCQL